MAKKSSMSGMRTVSSKAAINQGKGLGGAGMSSAASPKYKANKSIGEMKGKKPPIVEGKKAKKSKKATSKKGKIPPQFLENIKKAKGNDTITDGKKGSKKHKQKRYPGENVKDKVPHPLEKKFTKTAKKAFNKIEKSAKNFYGDEGKAIKVAMKAVQNLKKGKFTPETGGKKKAATKKKAVTTKKKPAAKKTKAKTKKKPIGESGFVNASHQLGKVQPTIDKLSPTQKYGPRKK